MQRTGFENQIPPAEPSLAPTAPEPYFYESIESHSLLWKVLLTRFHRVRSLTFRLMHIYDNERLGCTLTQNDEEF